MGSIMKKTKILAVILLSILVFTGCGSNFNQIGISMGNALNRGEVTSQSGNIYFIGADGIYKKDKKDKKPRRILKGDFSNLNAVGEKLYFYDKSISTICKANSEGFKVERIAEIYTDKVVVNKDNIFASILTGQGDENLESPDNYNIVSMKVTSRKLANTASRTVYKGGKLIGSFGDHLYVEKMEKKNKVLIELSLDGKNEKKIMDLPKDGKAIVTADKILVMGTVKDKFGVHKYTKGGNFKETLAEVGKNAKTKSNAFNYDGESVYYENYRSNDDGISDEIVSMNIKSKKTKVLTKKSTAQEYYLAAVEGKIFLKARKAGDLDAILKWNELKDEGK